MTDDAYSPAEDALPVVGLPCCLRTLGAHPFYVAGVKYVQAAAEGAGALPWLIPAMGPRMPTEALLDRLDGLVFTGSPSNVHPSNYHPTPESVDCGPYDEARDETTLPLLRGALARGLPILAICRGFQELNVAMGGALLPKVHETPGFMDHREQKDAPVDVQYGPAHVVRPTPGGLLARLAGGAAELTVNSLHGQGLDRVADGLTVEAVAPDGLVEAVSVKDHPFAVGVQWHPEWRFADNPFSVALFAAFGAAAKAQAEKRGKSQPAAAMRRKKSIS